MPASTSPASASPPPKVWSTRSSSPAGPAPATPSPGRPVSPGRTPTAPWKDWSPREPPGWMRGRPKRYRPESPAALIARISNDHGQALERLSRELEAVTVPETQTLVEIDLRPGAAPAHDARRGPRRRVGRTARAGRRVSAPRARASAPLRRRSCRCTSALTGPVDLGFATVGEISPDARAWPGMPVILRGGRSERDPRARETATRSGATGAPPPRSSPARGWRSSGFGAA